MRAGNSVKPHIVSFAFQGLRLPTEAKIYETCVGTADERIYGKDSCSYPCNQTVAKNLKNFRLERDLNP